MNNLEYYITDDVTLADAIIYVEEIFDPDILDSYIDSNNHSHWTKSSHELILKFMTRFFMRIIVLYRK